jgi:acetyl-CoA acetyltransferase
MAEAYIVAAVRTAGGRKGGRLAGWHPVDLAARCSMRWSRAAASIRRRSKT